MRSIFSSFLLFMLTWGLPSTARTLEAAKPWIGVSIEKGSKGVLINAVLKETPAARAGFQVGDEILKVDGQVVGQTEELIKLVQSKGVGYSISIEFSRQGVVQKKDLALEVQPDRLDMMRKLFIGAPAPGFEVVKLGSGELIRSQDLRGQVVLIEFWATWCPSCRVAMPFAERLAKEKKNLQVLLVTDEEEAAVKAFMGKRETSLRVVRDHTKKMSLAYQVTSVPTFFLLDKQGVVQKVELGAGSYLENLVEDIDRLLKQ